MAEIWAFIDAKELEILRWLHIVAMAYWLGGEWGVFNASREVTNASLTLGERLRHMETAYRIDILPRTGIILLLPLGLHMGHIWGTQPLGGAWLWGMWLFFAGWLSLTWTAFFQRGTDLGLFLTKTDEAIRWVVIPLLIGFGVYSLIAGWPFSAQWYSAKVSLYGFALIIGLGLRFIMRDWIILFRRIQAEGSTEPVEKMLSDRLAVGRKLAYLYWVVIIATAFFGAVKPEF